MDNDEQFKKHEPSHLVESLSSEDAAELERLGHHGIGDRLNRDKEEDLSLQHQIESNPLYQSLNQKTSQLPGALRNQTSFVHPLVSLFLSLTISIAGASVLYYCLQKPMDRLPAQVQAWPLVIGKVVHTVYHEGRTPTWDHTLEYKVDGKSFWFEEDGDGTDYDLSQVKYDPSIPSHFYRVPLEGEFVMGQIVGLIVSFIGLSILWDAAINWRSNDGRPIDVPKTAFAMFCAVIFALTEGALYLNARYSHEGNAYREAGTSSPVK